MKQILSFFAFILSLNNFSQIVTKDSIEIVYKECYIDHRLSEKDKITDGITLQLTGIELIIKNKFKKEIQLSSFSLIDTKKKFRYRLDSFYDKSKSTDTGMTMNMSNSMGMTMSIPMTTTNQNSGFPKYRKSKLYSKNGYEIISQFNIPDYDDSVIDHFYDYKFEGYTNIEFEKDYGSKNFPKKTITYLGLTSLKKIRCRLEFLIPELYVRSEYHLYYKDEKIATILF